MVQTKEEKNKVARDNRAARQHNQYRGLLCRYVRLWTDAWENRLPHAKILEVRATISHAGLPGWMCERLQGVSDAMFEQHYNRLVLCYAHPDTGELRPVRELIDAGLASRLDTNTCCNCYPAIDGKYCDTF